MMNTEQHELRASLEEAIRNWFEKYGDDLVDAFDCWQGENTPAHMADAAFAVLRNQADFQEYVIREGYMKEA